MLQCPSSLCGKLESVQHTYFHENDLDHRVKCSFCGLGNASKNWKCGCGHKWYRCSTHNTITHYPGAAKPVCKSSSSNPACKANAHGGYKRRQSFDELLQEDYERNSAKLRRTSGQLLGETVSLAGCSTSTSSQLRQGPTRIQMRLGPKLASRFPSVARQ